MPGWLKAFANHQPITQVIDAVRGFLLDRARLVDAKMALQVGVDHGPEYTARAVRVGVLERCGDQPAIFDRFHAEAAKKHHGRLLHRGQLRVHLRRIPEQPEKPARRLRLLARLFEAAQHVFTEVGNCLT